jgi:antitoxin VapB
MAFNVKNEEADQLLRQLTAVTGESLTEAITVSLRERLARERQIRQAGHVLTVEQAVDRFADRAVVDTRTDDEILGYDVVGIPS